jgi:hypothetical protein
MWYVINHVLAELVSAAHHLELNQRWVVGENRFKFYDDTQEMKQKWGIEWSGLNRERRRKDITPVATPQPYCCCLPKNTSRSERKQALF